MKKHFTILANENPDDHTSWIRACREFTDSLSYDVVDLCSNTWLEQVKKKNSDCYLLKPGGMTEPFKRLYDERVYIISEVLGLPVYPSLNECLIYENKRFLSYWLAANQVPHPKTWVFYDKREAGTFMDSRGFPVVAKINIGASGSGVRIIHSRDEGNKYIGSAFNKGIRSVAGPKLKYGNVMRRSLKAILNPSLLRKRIKTYRSIYGDLQKGFVIFQEYIPHNFEWRAVRIGNSFFAHKKIKRKDQASGTLLKQYERPPVMLLDFIEGLTDRFGFYSQAIDLFETGEGEYLVNEMQCIFGQTDPYLMKVEDEPGRFIKDKAEKWIFQKGDFSRNQSYNLRIEHLLDTIP